MDVGSGMGCWGKVFEAEGLTDITLIDHPALPVKDLLVSNKSFFLPVDMETQLPPVKRVGLVICTEVLEHFNKQRANEIMDYLTECSDLILFSAAIPRQGGLGHVNEQRHGYWHQRFEEKGFRYFDGFKIDLIANPDIIYYLRQNLFFYYKPSQAFRFAGKSNISAPDMEWVHISNLNRPLRIKENLDGLWQGIRRRMVGKR